MEQAVAPLGLMCDDWLGVRLGVPAFTLAAEADPILTPQARPAFLQAKVDSADSERLTALVRAGYVLIETSVTLEKAIGSPPPAPAGVRFAVVGDEAAVRQIAASAFTQSRFHLDPLIPRTVAGRIKADWAGNFFAKKRGTHMVIAAEAGEVLGFLLLIVKGDFQVVDLVAVAASAQGRGLGRAMLDFATRSISGPSRFVVGTQLCNVRSLAYYAGCGFRIVRAGHTLHRHLD